MLAKTEVEHIAKLARIALTQEEIEKFQKELGSILEYFALLNEADVSGARATTHSIAAENVTREDIGMERTEREGYSVLSMVPHEKGRYVKVKPILWHGKDS